MVAGEETNDEPGGAPEKADAERHAAQTTDTGHPVPLFLRDRSDGPKGDAQDEKDETGE